MSEQFPASSSEISQKNQELYAQENAARKAFDDASERVVAVEAPSDALLENEVHAAIEYGDAVQASEEFAEHNIDTLMEEALEEDVERSAEQHSQ